MKEPVPRLRSLPRRLGVLWTIARRHPDAPSTEAELVAFLTRLAAHLAQASGPLETARFLWTVEGLTFQYLVHRPRWPRFSDPRWPREALPMAHSGLGMAAALATGFHPERLLERIESSCAPGFREFAYESVGALFGALTDASFRGATALAKAFRLVRLPDTPRPHPSALTDLPTPARQLASHGYGRHLFFRSLRVQSALSAAQTATDAEPWAALRGVAGAFTLVNARDLASAVRLGEDLAETEMQTPVDDGVINALVLLLWTHKRAADAIDSPSPRVSSLLRRARATSEQAGDEGPRFLV